MQHLKKPVGQSFAKAPSMQPAPSIAGRYTFDSLVTKTGVRDAGQGHFELEREKLLQINLTEECSWAWIKIGSMVARTGKVTFRRQGAIEQGLKKLMMKTLTGEGVKLVKAEGVGKVFCADSGKTISVVQLDGESLYINGNDVLAISASLKYDITLMKGAGALAGGFFNVRVEGHGMVAFTCHGSVVTLQATEDHPVFTDPNATVAWTHNPQLKFDTTAKAVITGRGSGEEFQLRFSEGYVIIQPYEEISPLQAS